MKCAGHWVTSGNNGNGNGNGNVTTWVYDDLTASTDMANATYLDADGVTTHTGANCWKSLSIGSSASFTVPVSYSGPIYLNGGNVDFQGNFSCSACSIVMTNKDPTSTTIGRKSTSYRCVVNPVAVRNSRIAADEASAVQRSILSAPLAICRAPGTHAAAAANGARNET